MERKIVAIGGGENGRIRPDGTYTEYQTKQIDSRIVELTGKKHPNFCFIAHSQTVEEIEDSYFDAMVKIYNGIFGCECRIIKRKDLIENLDNSIEIINWADIIYEGGGDTKAMIEIWRKTSFDQILYNAYLNGKVMCGVSAGAIAWFKSCSSDSLKIETKDDNAPLITIECLGIIDAFLTPHYDIEEERASHMKESLKDSDLVGIGLSNCAALEIVDNKYKIITSSKEAYGVKAYWKENEYVIKKIEDTGEYVELDKLLKKE